MKLYLYEGISTPDPTYKCEPGQGSRIHGAYKKLQICSQYECQQACNAENDCKSIDHSQQCKFNSCRLYNKNIIRQSTGGEHRTYCWKKRKYERIESVLKDNKRKATVGY